MHNKRDKKLSNLPKKGQGSKRKKDTMSHKQKMRQEALISIARQAQKRSQNNATSHEPSGHVRRALKLLHDYD